MRIFSFDELSTADLHIDAVYQGGRSGNAGDDPFPKLLGVSNQGGFRYLGTLHSLQLVLLTSSMSDPDWPDQIDLDTGLFTYYGDNKTPGRALHETPRRGNELLQHVFELAHSTSTRHKVPPIFVFSSAGQWRDVVFRGLAVPGTSDLRFSEDLVALWKAVGGRRFQNYRARFTILDVPAVPRSWISDIQAGETISANAPRPWIGWIEGGRTQALIARRSVEYRTKREQLPQAEHDTRVLHAVYTSFVSRPHDFELFAATLTRMLLPDITSLDVTRPSRDGGRDAVGTLRIGHGVNSIDVTFAVEAKCYGQSNAVGVRETSRLISRLRHRQFGVLITTSYVDLQAYQEIKQDEHPIIIIAGGDIVQLLRANGYADVEALHAWLDTDFAPKGSALPAQEAIPGH